MLEHELHPQPGYPFRLGLTIEYALTDEGLVGLDDRHQRSARTRARTAAASIRT